MSQQPNDATSEAEQRDTAGVPPEATSSLPEPPVPPPEPLTPERVAAENRRNDLFIFAAVLIAAALFGFFKVNDPDVWLHLRSGWQIDSRGVPDTDPFAYPTADQKWINPHWLYDWALYKGELIETRRRVQRLADDYRRLLNARQAPKLDAKGADVIAPLSAESVRTLDQAIGELTSAADGSDTHAMRLAAERVADTAKSIDLQLPVSGQTAEPSSYKALNRYGGTGGAALVGLEWFVVVRSLVVVALAGALLCMRQPGPTAWWAAVVAAFILVAVSDRLTSTPEVLSLLFLALAFAIVNEFQTRRAWVIWLLVPLELAWVNIDNMFPLGLLVPIVALLSDAISRARGGTPDELPRPAGSTPRVLATATVAGCGATFFNPYHIQMWSVPIGWCGAMIGRMPLVGAYFVSLVNRDSEWAKGILEQGDFMGDHSADLAPPLSRKFHAAYFADVLGPLWEMPWLPVVTCALLLVAAAVTIAWGARGQRVGRALLVAIALGMFLIAGRYIGVAAILAGVVLGLNGQEWFLRRFGAETRMTNAWLGWSQGGRAVTIVGLALVAIVGMTGRFGAAARSEFGWGVLWVKFDFGAARFLREANLSGRMLNTVPVQGNLLIWSNYEPDKPSTRVFVDGRLPLHLSHLEQFETLKRALRDNDPPLSPKWKELLDELGVSHVLLNIHGYADRVLFLRSFESMHTSDDWQLIHLDSTHAIMGRTRVRDGDPLAGDVARIRELAVPASERVFRRHSERMPEPPPAVRPPGFVDWFWRSREFSANESWLAVHLLNPRMAAPDTGEPRFVVPTENCYLAIRAAREGLAKRQKVSPMAYESLSEAYFYLYNLELAQIPVLEAHQLRTMQLICSLNQLVAADPQSRFGRVKLAIRYLALQYLDLADEQLEAAIALMPEGESAVVVIEGGEIQKFSRDDLIAISERIKLNIERAENELSQLGSQVADPFARMNFLLARGLPGKAIKDLSETIAMSPGAMNLVPYLANLYIRTGQPGEIDRGAEGELKKLQGGGGGLKPGEFDEMFATVKLLQGDYENAKTFMEKAIAETRHAMAGTSLSSTVADLRSGSLFRIAETSYDMVGLASRQARLEYYLGMLQLEAGEPAEAVRHFRQSLLVRENVIYRPVIGMYLERITGEKLEPLPDEPSGEKPPEVETPPRPTVDPAPKPPDAAPGSGVPESGTPKN